MLWNPIRHRYPGFLLCFWTYPPLPTHCIAHRAPQHKLSLYSSRLSRIHTRHIAQTKIQRYRLHPLHASSTVCRWSLDPRSDQRKEFKQRGLLPPPPVFVHPLWPLRRPLCFFPWCLHVAGRDSGGIARRSRSWAGSLDPLCCSFYICIGKQSFFLFFWMILFSIPLVQVSILLGHVVVSFP